MHNILFVMRKQRPKRQQKGGVYNSDVIALLPISEVRLSQNLALQLYLLKPVSCLTNAIIKLPTLML